MRTQNNNSTEKAQGASNVKTNNQTRNIQFGKLTLVLNTDHCGGGTIGGQSSYHCNLSKLQINSMTDKEIMDTILNILWNYWSLCLVGEEDAILLDFLNDSSKAYLYGIYIKADTNSDLLNELIYEFNRKQEENTLKTPSIVTNQTIKRLYGFASLN